MKKLLLPILLFAFNVHAMEHLKEAEKLFEKSEASKTEKVPASSCADEREGRLDVKEKEVDYTWHSDLDENEWTERYGCKYCPKDGCKKSKPFDCKELLKNPYWQKVMKMSQEKKDDELADMMVQSRADLHYWGHRRCHIAAAVCAGANPNTKTKEAYWKRPLRNLIFQDPPMTKLLLERGADPHLDIERTYSWDHPAICEARTLKEAKLLFEYGASPQVQCSGHFRHSLLSENIIHHWGEAPDLIDLYLAKGVDPNKQSFLDGAPLHQLADPVGFFKPEEIRRTGKSLIQYGADVDAKNERGETAEDILLLRREDYDECSAGIDALLEVIREDKKKKSGWGSRFRR